MAISAGADIDANDFIDESQANATPSNDAGRVPKLESNGRLGAVFTRLGTKGLNAGETIAGGTLPVPVYQNTSDNELYACDGNDTAKLKFIGFATSNSTDGNPIKFQGAGIVSGFSGLTVGSKYYVQDSAGTIGATPGTYEVLVGVAISATEILIQKGIRRASGTTSFSSSSDQAITLGFRPSIVRIWAVADGGDVTNHSMGGWTVYGGNRCVRSGSDNGTGEQVAQDTSNAWNTNRLTGTADISTGVIGSVTDTGFTLDVTYTGGTTIIYWEAEGEL